MARCQTAGRGRFRRDWFSDDSSLTFTYLMKSDTPGFPSTGLITQVAGLALSLGIEDVTGLKTLIRWPNDIMHGEKKLAGILCEGDIEADAVRHAVVGIGINVNGRSFPAALAGRATSLAKVSGSEHSRPRLLAAVLNCFERDYRRWHDGDDLREFLPYLEGHSALRGKTVAVEGLAGQLTGRVEGIGAGGELLLRDARGEVSRISSGDVQVGPLASASPALFSPALNGAGGRRSARRR